MNGINNAFPCMRSGVEHIKNTVNKSNEKVADKKGRTLSEFKVILTQNPSISSQDFKEILNKKNTFAGYIEKGKGKNSSPVLICSHKDIKSRNIEKVSNKALKENFPKACLSYLNTLNDRALADNETLNIMNAYIHNFAKVDGLKKLTGAEMIRIERLTDIVSRLSDTEKVRLYESITNSGYPPRLVMSLVEMNYAFSKKHDINEVKGIFTFAKGAELAKKIGSMQEIAKNDREEVYNKGMAALANCNGNLVSLLDNKDALQMARCIRSKNENVLKDIEQEFVMTTKPISEVKVAPNQDDSAVEVASNRGENTSEVASSRNENTSVQPNGTSIKNRPTSTRDESLAGKNVVGKVSYTVSEGSSSSNSTSSVAKERRVDASDVPSKRGVEGHVSVTVADEDSSSSSSSSSSSRWLEQDHSSHAPYNDNVMPVKVRAQLFEKGKTYKEDVVQGMPANLHTRHI